MSTGSLSSSSPELSSHFQTEHWLFNFVKLSSSPEGAEIVILISPGW